MTLKAPSNLQGSGAPRVVTPTMLETALSLGGKPPSRGALYNWISVRELEGALTRVSKGLYLNKQALPQVLPEEAAQVIRRGATVSLQKVLGDSGVTNNFSSVISCVVPWDKGSIPSVGRVKTEKSEFHFYAMPIRILHAGDEDDRLASGYWYPRATPERALLDWIHLGKAPRSKLALPPLNTELDRLDKGRLKRLAKAMGLEEDLKAYLQRRDEYSNSPDVRANRHLD